MAGWFQHETSLKDSPKARDLADILGIKPVYARGHLGDFWSYVFDHHKYGVIEGRNLETKIAEGASWDGDAAVFSNALVEVRFMHRSEDASPDTCEQCFPPTEDGAPYVTAPGAFVVHGWEERIRYYLRFEERQKIKHEQDAARQRVARAKKAGKVLSVREDPRRFYGAPMPARRGLRAAPTIVHNKIRHAIESVTSRLPSVTGVDNLGNPVDTSRNSHADVLRDVTQPSRSQSREPIPMSMLNSPLSEAKFTPFDPAGIPPTTPKIDSDQQYSVSRDVTQQSRDFSRDVTQQSPCTNRQTEKPSSKDTLLSLSLKDKESLKSGANDAPLLDSDQTKEGEEDLTHQAVMDAWPDLYLAATGKQCPEVLGRLAGVADRWRKKDYTNREILRRMRFFFASTFNDKRARTFPIMEFQKVFNQLEHGPIIEAAALSSNRRSYGSNKATGGEDFRGYDPTKHDDFGPDN